jgi:hypothetical protein
MRNFIICTHPQIPLGKSSQVKANEMSSACSTHGRGMCTKFGRKGRRKETTWKTKA